MDFQDSSKTAVYEVCTLLTMVFVNIQVSAPYRRTAFTFELTIWTLVCCDSSLELHTFFSWRKAASVLPFLSMMLLRQVKDSTSSSGVPSSTTGPSLVAFSLISGGISGSKTQITLVTVFSVSRHHLLLPDLSK